MSMQLFLRCHCLRHALRCLQNRMFRLIHPPESTCTADPPVTILAFHAPIPRSLRWPACESLRPSISPCVRSPPSSLSSLYMPEPYAALYYHVYGRHPRHHHSPTLSPMPISDIEPYDRTPYRSFLDEPLSLLSCVQLPSLP